MKSALFTGRGTSGSWQIRGVQMAAALGTTSIPNASVDQMKMFDAVVIVKRVSNEVLSNVKASGRFLIWDVVDAWPQPVGNIWDRDDCLRWLGAELRRIKPDLVIGATEKMTEDVVDFGFKSVNIKHHSRIGLVPNPVRANVTRVGYEGGPNYVERWRRHVQRECAERGWEFVMDDGITDNLHKYDIVLALRDASGYAPRHWKSNVKLANAHASGTPFIGARERGYLETACGAEYWCSAPPDLEISFNWLESQANRKEVHKRFLSAASEVSVETISKQYRNVLNEM